MTNRAAKPPTVEQATVYRAGGRRWFTKSAAYRAAARAKINTRCDCEKTDYSDPRYTGYCCIYHKGERGEKYLRRLAGLIKMRYPL